MSTQVEGWLGLPQASPPWPVWDCLHGLCQAGAGEKSHWEDTRWKLLAGELFQRRSWGTKGKAGQARIAWAGPTLTILWKVRGHGVATVQVGEKGLGAGKHHKAKASSAGRMGGRCQSLGGWGQLGANEQGARSPRSVCFCLCLSNEMEIKINLIKK